MSAAYQDFLATKAIHFPDSGLDAVAEQINSQLFPFQHSRGTAVHLPSGHWQAGDSHGA